MWLSVLLLGGYRGERRGRRGGRGAAPRHTPCLFAGAFLLSGTVLGSDGSGELAAVPPPHPVGVFPSEHLCPRVPARPGSSRPVPAAPPAGMRGEAAGPAPREGCGTAPGHGAGLGTLPDTGESAVVTSVPVEGSAGSKSEWECVCVCYKGTRTALGNLRISGIF